MGIIRGQRINFGNVNLSILFLLCNTCDNGAPPKFHRLVLDRLITTLQVLILIKIKTKDLKKNFKNACHVIEGPQFTLNSGKTVNPEVHGTNDPGLYRFYLHFSSAKASIDRLLSSNQFCARQRRGCLSFSF